MIDHNQIKSGIAKACSEGNISRLTHFLTLENANVVFPQKSDFLFRVENSFNKVESRSRDQWTFKIREMTLDSGEIIQFYDFYNSVSKFPQLSILYSERDGKLIVDIIPF